MKEHSGARGLPPRGAVVCMEGWMTSREVVTFVECKKYEYKEYRGCEYKGIKT